jgi:hypothetical protein
MATPALRAWTNLAQIKPRINSQIVLIVPGKFQRVLADGLCRQCLYQRLKHRKRPGCQCSWLASLSPRFRSLIFAECAGTSVPQKRKRVGRPVAVLPLDLHPRARRQMNDNRLGIVPHPRSEIWQRHEFQYRMGKSTPMPGSKGHPGPKEGPEFQTPLKNCHSQRFREGHEFHSCRKSRPLNSGFKPLGETRPKRTLLQQTA